MIEPKPLSVGDRVIIVSTSRMVTKDQIESSIELLETWGLKVDLADNVYDSLGYLAGDDDIRLKNLQQAIDSTEYKAILCSRGGYGLGRIVDDLDFNKLKKYPKWIVGFSDITALHLPLNHQQIQTLHAVMPVQYDYDGINKSVLTLKEILFGKKLDYYFTSHHENVIGVVQGELIGGNLSLLADSLGTISEIDTTGKILFVEEVDEYYYKVDRMLNQLKRAGKFKYIKGLIVGQFSDLKDTQIPFGQSLFKIVKENLDGNVPICFNAPIGHTVDNWALPCGRMMKLSVTTSDVNLKEIERSI